MSELVSARIREYAGKLGLTHLIDTIDQLTARAEAEQLGYLEFLDQVLEEELGLRESRRFRNALKLSGLPHHKTLDEFDFAFQPELDPRKIRDLCQAGYSIYFTSLDDLVRRPLGPPAGSTDNSAPTYDPPSSWLTKWATCRWTAPKRTWSSSWSRADTNAGQ